MKKILVVFGTRPEAIKMAPLVRAFLSEPGDYETRVCVTAQHREMLDQVIGFFGIVPDYDLNLMKARQDLYQLTADVLAAMKPVLEEYEPEYVFVQGDTITAFAAALAAFYAGSKVCHIEAGLRTFNKKMPFPEEMNRKLISGIADLHFAPTERAMQNLLDEGLLPGKMKVTGNTVIDALLWASDKIAHYEDQDIRMLKKLVLSEKKIILVTGHRRENFGAGFMSICEAILELARRDDVQVIYPVHLNPEVQQPVYDLLEDIEHITLTQPLTYPAFVWLMQRSYLIITDSGGIQEEAPSLGKPLLLMRETTERPEAVACGNVKLTGQNKLRIVKEATMLLDNDALYREMSIRHNPYGDGKACERIIQFLNQCAFS